MGQVRFVPYSHDISVTIVVCNYHKWLQVSIIYYGEDNLPEACGYRRAYQTILVISIEKEIMDLAELWIRTASTSGAPQQSGTAH